MEDLSPKKYYVLILFRISEPSVVFSTDIEKDAYTYAEIMKRANPNNQYIVVKDASK